jgi:RNA polymerase sigma factor (sigma-70 family)
MGVIGFVAEARRLGDAETRQPGEDLGIPQQAGRLDHQPRRAEGAAQDRRPGIAAEGTRGTDIASLVQRAADGDKWAWERLVDQYARLIWAMTRDFKLIESDAADVAQATWLRLLEHIDRLDHPARVGAWLATTARHECLRSLAARKRIVLMHDDSVLAEGEAPGPAIDERLLADERAQAVREALSHLPWRWQRLLQLLMSDPPASYAEISDELGLPVGSIGPTRGRCLERLRVLLEAS